MTPPNENWSLSVVSPVYNEAENIGAFLDELLPALSAIAPPGGFEVLLVNDGSSDATASVLDAAAKSAHPVVKAIHLSRNFGMEAAIHAGLERAQGNAIIVMDSDLQDDPHALNLLVDAWHNGADVAYAVRTSRKEGLVRRSLFWLFYRLLGAIANIALPNDASNFALMDRRVCQALLAMPERNRFLRGLRAWVGFRQVGVPVARRARHQGDTRLGFRGQWKLAMNAIFAFSYAPLFLFRIAGLCALCLCAALITWALYHKLIAGLELKAWASELIVTCYLGGINLLGIGIVGEYIARIYDQVKRRPHYIVARIVE